MDKIKYYLGLVIGFLAVVAGSVIYALMATISKLKGQAAIKDAEREIADVITKKEAASREADAAVVDFRNALANESADDT